MLEVCLWQPLCSVPWWRTAHHCWWLDHEGYHDVSTAGRLPSEGISDHFGGCGGGWIKEDLRKIKCIPFYPFKCPPPHTHTEFLLNLMANPFWLCCSEEEINNCGKWENNGAAQHQLWSIHLNETRLAGREEITQWGMEVASLINAGVLSGATYQPCERAPATYCWHGTGIKKNIFSPGITKVYNSDLFHSSSNWWNERLPRNHTLNFRYSY